MEKKRVTSLADYKFFYSNTFFLVVLFFFSLSVSAQLPTPPDEESLHVTAKRAYSPYAERDFPTRPMWGDTHLHTAFSFDAGTFGARLLPPMPIALPRVKNWCLQPGSA